MKQRRVPSPKEIETLERRYKKRRERVGFLGTITKKELKELAKKEEKRRRKERGRWKALVRGLKGQKTTSKAAFMKKFKLRTLRPLERTPEGKAIAWYGITIENVPVRVDRTEEGYKLRVAEVVRVSDMYTLLESLKHKKVLPRVIKGKEPYREKVYMSPDKLLTYTAPIFYMRDENKRGLYEWLRSLRGSDRLGPDGGVIWSISPDPKMSHEMEVRSSPGYPENPYVGLACRGPVYIRERVNRALAIVSSKKNEERIRGKFKNMDVPFLVIRFKRKPGAKTLDESLEEDPEAREALFEAIDEMYSGERYVPFHGKRPFKKERKVESGYRGEVEVLLRERDWVAVHVHGYGDQIPKSAKPRVEEIKKRYQRLNRRVVIVPGNALKIFEAMITGDTEDLSKGEIELLRRFKEEGLIPTEAKKVWDQYKIFVWDR
jgi:hypothetical protein